MNVSLLLALGKRISVIIMRLKILIFFIFWIFSTDSFSQSNHYWFMANHVLYAKRGPGIFFS